MNNEHVTVTQADRQAAENAYYTCFEETPNLAWMDALLNGKHDDDPVVQAFARHRIEATAKVKPDTQALLQEALAELKHCAVFVRTREKMHPDGVRLYDKLLAKIEQELGA